jgi:uncharacterized protein YndB with AHSA1/START domain
MYEYVAERDVRRPVDEVFAYLADATRQTEWVHGVSACTWEGAAEPRLGATAQQSMTFMGKLRVVPMEIVAFEPGRRVWFEKRHPFRVRFGFELEPRGDTTHLRYPVELYPTGVFRLVIPIIARRTIEGDLDRITARIEGHG